MAISTIRSGTVYDVNRDEYYDSHAQYMRHTEHLRIEQMREEDRRRNAYAAQQQIGHNPFVIREGVEGNVVGVRPQATDSKDPLAFLQNTDKKLLLTGEMQ